MRKTHTSNRRLLRARSAYCWVRALISVSEWGRQIIMASITPGWFARPNLPEVSKYEIRCKDLIYRCCFSSLRFLIPAIPFNLWSGFPENTLRTYIPTRSGRPGLSFLPSAGLSRGEEFHDILMVDSQPQLIKWSNLTFLNGNSIRYRTLVCMLHLLTGAL